MTDQDDQLHAFLALLAEELRRCDELRIAERLEAAATGSNDRRLEFLKSNELWGGAGSIADQAGVRVERGINRKRIEYVLRDLGLEQIRQGFVNLRTSTWVEAFQKWIEIGIEASWELHWPVSAQ